MSISAWYLLARPAPGVRPQVVHDRPDLRSGVELGDRSCRATSRPAWWRSINRRSWPRSRVISRPASADLHLFGVPDVQKRRGQVRRRHPRRTELPRSRRLQRLHPRPGSVSRRRISPPCAIPFLSYHLMVGLGSGLHRSDAAGSVLPLARHAVRETLAVVDFRRRRRRAVPRQRGGLGVRPRWDGSRSSSTPNMLSAMERGADGLVKMQGGLRTHRRVCPAVRVVGTEQVIGFDRHVQRDLRAVVRRVGVRAQQQDPAWTRRSRSAAAERDIDEGTDRNCRHAAARTAALGSRRNASRKSENSKE